VSTQTKENARAIFSEFLEKNKHRKTPERFAIFDEVYARNDHFDVEMLYFEMKNKNYHVSRATVYNTLNLLLECNLVVKHQFKKNVSLYERAYGYKQHDHMICNHCDRVFEFCDPRIQATQSMVGELLQFNVQEHALTLYGDPQNDGKGRCVNCREILPDQYVRQPR
jgi:Fur family ferric uptake transcriptional regulator